MVHHNGGWILAMGTVDVMVEMALGHAVALVDL